MFEDATYTYLKMGRKKIVCKGIKIREITNNSTWSGKKINLWMNWQWSSLKLFQQKSYLGIKANLKDFFFSAAKSHPNLQNQIPSISYFFSSQI